jgi:mRNA-degrading endonuclease RelE of RelBE toxin-antitoxin system
MNDSDYQVALTRRADKDLDDFPGQEETIIRQLAELSKTPKSGKPLAGALSGTYSIVLNIPASGQYRAAYVLDDERQECLIFLIGPRENFYTKAQRRAGAL